MDITSNGIYWPTAKILLSVASPVVTPIQNMVSKNCVTHSFCNQRAMEILYQDDKKSYARITDIYLDHLNKGVNWADTMGKSLSHFFIPSLRRGVGKFSNAAWECRFYFNKALKKWHRGQREKAYFYLGAAAHLVQDLCVPHHATGVLLDGHQEYENWAEANRSQYMISSGGAYNIGVDSADWVVYNALIAERLFDYVTLESSADNYDYATEIVLPQAQRSTAGFIALFLDQVFHS